MNDYQKKIQDEIDLIYRGRKLILKSRCRGKPMKEINVNELINMNYRVLTLLGYATSMIMTYEQLEAYHGDEEKCKWFFDAVQAVVYENKPLPPMP